MAEFNNSNNVYQFLPMFLRKTYKKTYKMAKMDKNDLNIAGFSWDDFRFPPKLFR